MELSVRKCRESFLLKCICEISTHFFGGKDTNPKKDGFYFNTKIILDFENFQFILFGPFHMDPPGQGIQILPSAEAQ